MARAKPVERVKFSTNLEPSGLNPDLVYESQGAILTEGELRFYNQGLRPAIKRYKVLVKCRLADVVRCPPEFWRSGAGARIAQKHCDFVLVRPRSMKIVCVVELDGKTHLEPEQQLRDRFLDDVLLSCGIPIMRFPVYARYSPKRIKQIILGTLKRHLARKRLVDVA